MSVKKISRLKKTTYNIVSLSISEIIAFICSLILPRIILKTYGSEYNGLVSSITQFLGFISVLRLGVAGSTRVELYKSLAHNDTEKTSSILVATERYMKRIAFIFIGYLLLLSIIYPLFIHSDNIGYLEILSLVLIIGMGTFAQYFFGITYSTLLQADQKVYIYNIIQSIATILNTLIASFLVLKGFSIQLTKLISSLIFTISPIILNIYVTRKYCINKKAIPDTRALEKKNDAAASSIANIIHDGTDLVVLTLLTNVKIVSIYAVYNYVINGLQKLLTVFTNGLESLFGELWVKKDLDRMEERLENYEFFINCFNSVIYPSAFILIVPFVSVYTKGVTDVNYINYYYAFLVLLAQFFMGIRIPYLTVVQATGKYKETKKGAFLEAGINITLSVVLTLFLGIIGVVIGTLVANLFRTLQYYFFINKNLLKRPKFILLKNMFWTALNISVSVLISHNLFDLSSINNYLEWAKIGLFSSMISVVIVSISALLFKRDEVNSYLKILRRRS